MIYQTDEHLININTTILEKNYIHIVFVISLLLTLMKGADLLLRPHQQKWLQEKLEIVTLKLTYTNFFRWYSEHLNSWMLKFVGLFSLILVTSILHDPFLTILSTALKNNGLLFISAIGLSTAFALRMRSTHKSSLEYIEGKDTENVSLMTFLKRSLEVLRGFFILIFLAFIFYFAAFYSIDKFILKENLPIFIYSIICITPVSINGLGIFFSLLIVLLLTCIVGLLHFLLKAIEAACWRIVEYNKGAFAAINIVITVGLGIAELCLK